jgi:AraC family transcriptional regulator of adaptative response / DNA-3-methyladenine glycosylase II
VTLSAGLATHRREIASRVQRLFDLDADITTITAALAHDPALRPLLRARPGLRVPGGWGSFELGLRAILGQQVSVAAARGLAARLVELCGTGLPGSELNLTRVFPGPGRITANALGAIGMPGARRETLLRWAAAAAQLERKIEDDNLDRALDVLTDLPGIGP